MKTNKELLEIHDRQNKSVLEYWKYNALTPEEKARLFDLLTQRNPMEVTA